MTVFLTRRMKEIVAVALLLCLQQCTPLYVAPPLESCPNDSIQVGDTCKCDYKQCTKPPCLYDLNISVNSTDTPGNCCAIYSCDGCKNDTLLEGKCPCAPGAVLNAKGECKCVDAHKNLVNNECVCDPDLCELPQICDKNSVSVSEKEGCCVKTKCIECPPDSFPSNNNDEAIEDKCVCYPCPNECKPDERVVVIQRVSGFPGNCCDLYTCESNAAKKKCIVDEVVYGEGESWETSDSQICKCRDGISFCSKPTDEESFRSCHNEGSVYKHHESWMVDSCTNCTCFNGETKCIAHMCEVPEGQQRKPPCQPLNCSKVCPDGYKLNKRGCKICKCNTTSKYDDLLHQYNITRNKLKEILDDYFARTSTEENSSNITSFSTTTVDSITVLHEHEPSSTPNARSDDWLTHVILWPGLGAVVVVIILLLLMKKCRSQGSYDTNSAATIYERVKLKKDTLFNNNYINKNIKGGT